MRKLKLVGAVTISTALAGVFAGCAAGRECGLRGCAGDERITTKVRSLLDEHPDIGTEVNVQTLNHISVAI